MIKPWNERNHRSLFTGRLFRCEEFLGESTTSGRSGCFERLHFAPWVNVIALTPENQVVMVKQWRHGNQLTTIELPGGALDFREENPLEAAKREFAEETGYQAESWKLLGETLPNPAFMANICSTYLCKNARPFQKQSLDPSEEIEVVLVPLREIPQRMFEREFSHSLIVAAFGLLLAKAPDLFKNN